METELILLVASLASVIAVCWIYPYVLVMARKGSMLDTPDSRKLQKEPVPVLGGVAVSFGILVGLLVCCSFSELFGLTFRLPAFSIIYSMVIMLLVGAIDDSIGLSPFVRFIIEILVLLCIMASSGGCINSLHGLWGVFDFSMWIAIPLTLFACVGIINAINMIDGVNGLSSSLCIISNLLFGCAFVQSGMLTTGIINITMAASLLPFLFHNVFGLRSKMFIGDAGTMVMGTVMSYDVIQILRADTNIIWMQYTEQGMGLVAFALSVLAVPVGDTLRVMTLRIVHHTSPFLPDKTHLHHVLMEYSQSHTLTTLMEVLIALLIFGSWLLTYMLGGGIDVQFYVVLLVSMLLVWGLYGYLTSHRTIRTGLAWRLRTLFARLRQSNSSWWKSLQAFADRGM